MKLYIPILGEQLRLTADWKFDLYNEERNSTLMNYVGDTREIIWRSPQGEPCMLPAGTILKCDRIFIRKGSEDYNSITFFLVGKKTETKWVDREEIVGYEPPPQRKNNGSPFNQICFGKPIKKIIQEKIPSRAVRFWVTLEDANSIEFDKV